MRRSAAELEAIGRATIAGRSQALGAQRADTAEIDAKDRAPLPAPPEKRPSRERRAKRAEPAPIGDADLELAGTLEDDAYAARAKRAAPTAVGDSDLEPALGTLEDDAYAARAKRAEPAPMRDADLELAIGTLEDDAYAALAALDSIQNLRAALANRDAVELRLIGAEAILGRAPELSIDDASELIAFEEALHPQLWRLTALNEWRALEVDWIAPAYRARFWWWSEASEIDPRGALHLGAVAELVARFPEAVAHLRRLTATELLMRSRPAAVIDLGAWIRGRMPSVALAASTGEREQVLLEHASFTLSILEDALLIDLLEPCGAHPPRLQIDDRVIHATPVPDALERYRFELALLLHAEHAQRAELILALASGPLRVSLPPDQRSAPR